MKRAVLKCLAFALTAVFAFSALTACNKDKVSISAAKTEVVYNGEAQLPEITVKGTEEKTVEIYAGETKVAEAVDAGKYSVKVTAGEAVKSFDFTITKKPVSLSSLAGFEKEYDGTDEYRAEIASPDGTVIGDQLTAEISGRFASPDIGAGKALSEVSAALTGADKDNYSLNTAETLTADVVAKVLTIGGITVEPAKFGDVESAGVENYEVKYSGKAELSGVVDGENVSVNIASIRFTELKVGECALAVEASLGGEDAANYVMAADGGLTGMILEDESVFTVSADGELTAYAGDRENLVVPASVGGIAVKSIAAELFKNTSYEHDGFKTVVLPSGLEKIGEQAFANNYVLEKITIPASVTQIGDSAFYSCSELKTIVFEEGGEALTVGVSAFERTSATDVEIPSRMTEIPRYCFADSDGGSGYVEIPKEVKIVGQEAFLNRSNSGGFTEIRFEKGGTETLRLEKQALAGARFNAVEIPARCAFIGFACMQNCKFLTSLTFEDRTSPVEWGQNEAAGGPFTFAGCDLLESVTLPAELGSFKGSFQECLALKTVVIEEGITEIGDYAFFGSALTRVSIPKSVASVGLAAFQNCMALTEMNIETGEGEADLTIADWAFSWAPITRLHFPARVVSIGFAAFKNHNATAVTFELQREKTLNFEHHPFAAGMPDESSAFNLDQPRTMDPVVLPKNINLTIEEISALTVFPAGTQMSISQN